MLRWFCLQGKTPSVLPLRVKPHSPFCRYATSSPGAGEVVPQGDGFSGGGKLYGSTERRPLGGAVAQRLRGCFARGSSPKTS